MRIGRERDPYAVSDHDHGHTCSDTPITVTGDREQWSACRGVADSSLA